MVSTFTSNLAAFLTVERMQATGEGGVKNIDMLADQSRISYTMLKGSSVEQYFKNMAAAEDELYGCVLSSTDLHFIFCKINH